MVCSQQPRRRRVAEFIVLRLKHSVRSKEAQDAAERIGVGTDRRRKVSSRSRCFVQHIGDAEVGDYVQAPRQKIAGCHLYQCIKRIGFSHGTPL